ncbi:Metallo-dependent phosphatase [Pholiota conissans]|uniref:Metallo-dependent phosphatase n=1 Tax=Pholiota conissans TaxID=109636 RepID=A0A9P5ZEF6_9AGAR|nr:Metallo-dependent phosphatase [Pholiota conissans]
MAALARRRVVVNVLRVFWVLLIFWYEYATFSASVHSCKWPDSAIYMGGKENVTQTRPAHVLLVADPQIIDRNSYPTRSSFSAYLTRLIVDLNLRKNWHAAIKKNPDAIVFLGDMMDNGRNAMSTAEYEEYYARFKHIFKADHSIPQYFIPGNHDVGLGKALQVSPHARSRYVAHFGPPNRKISIADHSLILFDAPGYADEDSQRHGQKKTPKQWIPIRGGALDFAKKYGSEEHKDPVVLFSHIPLYRTDGKSCGPFRERGSIRPGVGPGYQNILEKQSSQRLLELFKPVVIYSGDDHDYCEHYHQTSSPSGQPHIVREVTVKTISMVMNVKRPGFQLLSLVPSELRTEGLDTYADQLCLLPDQLRIYLNVYLPLLALSLLAVLASNVVTLSPAFQNRTTSDATVLFQADLEEADVAELNPRYAPLPQRRPPFISLMPTALSENSFASRSNLRSPNWVGPPRQANLGDSRSIWLAQLRDSILFCQQGRVRKPPRRRNVFSTTLLDARDIAVFPLAVFVLITWLVVTK